MIGRYNKLKNIHRYAHICEETIKFKKQVDFIQTTLKTGDSNILKFNHGAE